MTHPRISIESVDRDAQHEELLDKARALGGDKVSVEVEYIDPVTGEYPDWAEHGDAVEVDFTTEPPTITTLPPYEEPTA